MLISRSRFSENPRDVPNRGGVGQMSCMERCGNKLQLVPGVGDMGDGNASDSSSVPPSDTRRDRISRLPRQLPRSSYSSRVMKFGVARSTFASHSRSHSAREVVFVDSHEVTGDGKGGEIGDGQRIGTGTSTTVSEDLGLEVFFRAFFTCLTLCFTVLRRFLRLLESRRNLFCVGGGDSGSGARAPLREYGRENLDTWDVGVRGRRICRRTGEGHGCGDGDGDSALREGAGVAGSLSSDWDWSVTSRKEGRRNGEVARTGGRGWKGVDGREMEIAKGASPYFPEDGREEETAKERS
ncbi:hypothetical protein C8F04DRAFT_1176173 [Mycena alexandri]|uniref:Uncharacterized protein n=1 Tax=Mycena alexandri TaxID=1745969 RepID=A0AAD6TBT9_9AGAR|nr:hypothetical protein C8F04DRAFT_1176173 [Mycena alexandri]